MENFAYEEMTSQDVYMVKKTFHEQSNNKQAIDAFNIIMKETQIAITNIENVVKSEDELRQLLIKLRNGDVSFAKEVLGLSPKGKNDSCYRAYLAIDKQNIIEVRFANHYETLRAARDKSNNKSQFLFQVVVLTPQTKIQKDSITEPTAVVGNLKVLTNKPLSFSMSNDEELKATLMSIHDYLISPSETFENTKPTITQNNESKATKFMKQNKKTINEAQLRKIIAESVKNVLKEKDGVYSMFPYQSDIFRYAYNHQTVRSKLDDVYRLVDAIAAIASSEGRDNYAQFYGKLKTDLAQVYRLWDFLDED